MVRTNQGGSILGFIIIGSVMALLLLGGIFAVRQFILPSTDSGTVAVGNDTSDTAEDEGDQSADEATGSDGSEEVVPFDWQTTDESETEAEPHSETKTETDSGTASLNNLPSTGPGNVLLSGFLLSGMMAATIAYKRSRDLYSSL